MRPAILQERGEGWFQHILSWKTRCCRQFYGGALDRTTRSASSFKMRPKKKKNKSKQTRRTLKMLYGEEKHL